MGIYILKFSACLIIFMMFYKLFLERENMHHFKRFYLLIIIAIALIIPSITFIEYIEPIQIPETFNSTIAQPVYFPETIETPKTSYLPIVLWSIYLLGALLFLTKFCINIYKLVLKIKSNPKYKSKSIINVLIHDLVIPHTFLSYVFLNKSKFESNQIPKEVIIHEETHATQKHSLDIIVLELLQIIFWFNPLIYWVKQEVKLNHEFLADAAVLKQGANANTYQNLLLAFSSNAREPQLAHAINYSSIKKRFTVMKTQTSKQKIWLRSLVLLPLIAVTLYGFSQKREVVKEASKENSLQHDIENSNSEKEAYYKNATFKIKDKQDHLIATKTYSELTSEEKDKLLPPMGIPKRKSPSQADLNRWKDSKTYGVWYDGKRIDNGTLSTFSSSDFHLYYESKLEKNAINYGKHYYQVGLYSEAYYNNQYKNGVTPLSNNAIITITQKDYNSKALKSTLNESVDIVNNTNSPVLEISFNPSIFELNGKKTSLSQLKEDFIKVTNNKKSDLRIKTIGGIKMSLINEIMDKLKGNLIKIRLDEAAYIIGDTTSSNYEQKEATKEQIAEYNKLAKYCNIQIEKTGILKHKDVVRLKELYALMNDEQKKNAEPFPDFSKLLPPPPPETGFIEVNGETLFYVKFNPTRYYNRKGNLVDKNGNLLNGNKQVNASDVLPGQYITKIYKDDKIVSEFYDNRNQDVPPPPPAPKVSGAQDNVPPPPPPPAPKSPLDHVIEMAKKGATFYYEGKPISSDEAISLLKKNDELNISTKQINSKQPKVYITKDPITIDNSKKKMGNNTNLPKPTSKNALSHLKVMNRHGAKFYLDGKEVPFENALKAVRKNKNADINSTQEPPVVKISTKLIGVLNRS